MALRNAYASLGDLKEQLRKTAVADDAKLERALNGASRAIDRYAGRRFWLDTDPTVRDLRVVRDALSLAVPDIGDASSVIVATDDLGDGTFATTWQAGEFLLEPEGADQPDPIVEPFTALRAASYSRVFRAHPSNARPSVRVTARFGWPGATVTDNVAAAPDDVVEATLIKAARLFRRRDTPEGVAGNADTGVVRLTRHDVDVMDLLDPFVREDGRSGQAGIA